ncbi:MAG: poly(3-hydroxybutyrate) depolymerase [Marinospirillum sp.]|uniref:extracellular catalytic domain type 2 short-chain-length polyhydroxyalkanoate depolymerase n=1 Tax=Marinospirillum sp. TaxID=2183934 RepID=UPI0019DDDABD|nr:PHB depolymerase family esterase [Marinospirillum sp.]MBE0506147.1 poly(3-hydroxybutyrate) depolymerase [Marinospirillum sp.]
MKQTFSRSAAGLLLLLSGLLLVGCSSSEQQEPPLPQLNTDSERLYLAGLSSGGYLAHQLHLAWPDEVRGVAVFAAGPYGCAREGLSAALHRCMAITRGAPQVDQTLSIINTAAKEGAIGDPTALKNSRVYLYRGAADPLIHARVSQTLQQTYAQLVPDGTLSHTGALAGHGFPTRKQGVLCSLTASPYVNACGYDGAAASLEHLDGEAQRDVSDEPQGSLTRFDQKPFKGASKGLADWGYVYVPPGCAEGACGLQVVLHGCDQTAEQVGEDFVRLTGYLQQADARDLVMLFPQARASLPNPKGCWDWWGYESKVFDTREGPQMKAVRAMWQQLGSTVTDKP